MKPTSLLLLLLSACGSATSPDDAKGGAQQHGDDEPWSLELDPLCSPFAMGNDCITPWPSVFHTVDDADSPTGRRLNYSLEGFWSPDGPLPVDPAMFNFADGVSPVSPIFINLGRDVDPTQLWGPSETQRSLEADGPIMLVDAETGARVPLLTEMDRNQRDMGYEGRHALIIRPLAPLEHGRSYVVGITSDLRDSDGQPFTSPDGFTAIRDSILTDNDRIESARDRFEAAFESLARAGLEREDLLIAWEIPVASEEQVLGPIRSMREQASLENAAGIPYTIDSVETDPSESAWKVVRGTFQPPNFLNTDNQLEFDGGEVLLQTGIERPAYPFTLYLPAEAAAPGTRLPLVVVGHGLFGTGESWLAGDAAERVLQPGLASLPAAGIATDWIGLSGGDLELILSEVITDLSNIQLVTDRLAQSLVNNLTLVELAHTELVNDPAIGWTADGTHLDRDQTWYYGGSLGGIQGASFTAVSPDVTRSVLAVPGAGWSTMLQRSIHYGNIETLVDVLYPDPLSQSLFLSMLQTFFDRSDPAGLAGALAADDSKTVLLQEAVGDVQVPNVSTDLLARAMGAHHLEEAPRPIASLPTETSPSRGPALTQTVIPDALADYTPPETNEVPTEENGVHYYGPSGEEAVWQAIHLLGTGEAVHPCDGPCDPD